MKDIKNKTYHNFMIIYNQMIRKGYDKAEAEKITHRIFDEYAANPQGLSIRQRAALVITYKESIDIYGDKM